MRYRFPLLLSSCGLLASLLITASPTAPSMDAGAKRGGTALPAAACQQHGPLFDLPPPRPIRAFEFDHLVFVYNETFPEPFAYDVSVGGTSMHSGPGPTAGSRLKLTIPHDPALVGLRLDITTISQDGCTLTSWTGSYPNE